MKTSEFLNLIILAFNLISFIENADVDQTRPVGVTKKKTSKNKKIERIDYQIKPPNDNRSYRGLKLNNGMKVLLISDPLTKKSGAAMTVGVGALNDTRDVPGLINFVGILLTKSSKKYPKRFSFQKFVGNHGGVAPQPLTKADEQDSGFFIDPSYLSQGLERYAQLFLAPELSYAPQMDLNDVVHFIQTDFEAHAKTDAHRIAAVEKAVSKKNHPFNHLFQGNRETLYQHTEEKEVDLRNASLYSKAQKAYMTWYSSNVMTLAVLGRESLDELEELVVPLFKTIKNKNLKRIIYGCKHHPWGPDELKHKIYIVPLKDIRTVRLSFPVPDMAVYYSTAPEDYVTFLLRHRDPDTLYSMLRKNNLCTDLEITYQSSAGISFFGIICDITEEGEGRVDEIIHIIFQYIRLLKDKGVKKWIFQEFQNIHEMSFLDYEVDRDENVLSQLESSAHSMQSYPLEDILTYNHFQDKWDPSIIMQFLSYLKPDNMNVFIVSKSFENVADQEEKYFKTPYGVEKIPDELICKWNYEEYTPQLRLPSPNEFLPESLTLYPIEEEESNNLRIIHESPIFEIWFKQEAELTVPKCEVNFEIRSSTGCHDPIHLTSWRLFDTLLTNSLVKDPRVTDAGYKWEVRMSDNGMHGRVFGYNDKLPLVLEKLISIIVNLGDELDEENFIESKKEYTQIVEEEAMENSSFIMDWYMQYLQNQNRYTHYTILKVVKMDMKYFKSSVLQFKDMKKFLSKMFRRIFIQAFVYGNCNKQKAIDIVNIFEKTFRKSHGLLPQEFMLVPRYLEIAAGAHYVYHVFNKTPTEYGYSSYFQLNTEPSTKKNVASCLLWEIIFKSCNEMFPDHVKNKSASPFVCTFYQTYGLRGLMLTVKTKKDPRYIDTKTENFLRSVSRTLENLSIDDIESFKKRLELKEYAEPFDLVEQSSRYWMKISGRHYSFDEPEIELKHLNSLTKANLLAFFREAMDTAAPLRRRKLSVFSFPEGMVKIKPGMIQHIPAKAIKIEDIDAIKNNFDGLPFYYRSIPSSCIQR